MKTKVYAPGDKVLLKTKTRNWEGHILESYDPEIILLKLFSGYNIGIRENEILNVKLLKKSKELPKKIFKSEINKNKKNIALIITGGTISSRLDSKTGAVISTDTEAILNIVPEIKNIANIVKIEKPFLIFSENMSHIHWTKIAKTIEPILNDESIDGIIIAQGTDTLSYTGAGLSFFIKNLNKPIALTYSQKSIDRGSTDAYLNLLCSAKYATSDIAEIAIVGHFDSNDNSCIAINPLKARKMHTSKRDAFKPINTEPIAKITRVKENVNLKILKGFRAKDKSKKVKIDTKYLPNVALIKLYPGQDPSIIDYYQEKGYKGLIIETTGLGHVPDKDSNNNWLPKIKKAINTGMTICATATTIYGRLNPDIYATGRNLQKTGIIFLEDMLSETAIVKLSWILAHPSWKKTIKEKMLENISGEFNPNLK
jgi:glutamyl-tRNA(Gln) amidotransferase subunit D